MMAARRTALFITGIAITGGLALAGCSTPPEEPDSATTQGTESDASRVKLYSSLSELASESSQIVSGTVTAQRVVSDITPDSPFTISTVQVASAPKSDGSVSAGDTVEVRQLGAPDTDNVAPMLTEGDTYLLYLTESGLDGDLADQYYVTGAEAGLYKASTPDGASTQSAPDAASADTTFSRMSDSEDAIPEEVSLSDVQG